MDEPKIVTVDEIARDVHSFCVRRLAAFNVARPEFLPIGHMARKLDHEAFSNARNALTRALEE